MKNRDNKGRFIKGISFNPETQFKKGEHWRKEKPFWDKYWLISNYIDKKRSALEIAGEFGVTENAILFWLKKHSIKTRTMKEIRETKKWGLSGSDNPMWNKKGELNPNWRGGITPERNAFYSSQEWKKACSSVWKRDKATCKRCGTTKKEFPDIPFHIHHIKSFKYKELRAEVNNLILLCEICHHWVHSRRNENNEFL